MKVGGAILTALVLLALTATSASAAPSVNQRVAKLERLVRTQAAQIQTLNQRLAQTESRLVAAEGRLAATDRDLRITIQVNKCLHALATDGIHLAWYGVNILANEAGFASVFAPWQKIDDQGACAAIGVKRDAFLYISR